MYSFSWCEKYYGCVNVRVCVSVCECVCERECVCVCVHMCMCVWMLWRFVCQQEAESPVTKSPSYYFHFYRAWINYSRHKFSSLSINLPETTTLCRVYIFPHAASNRLCADSSRGHRRATSELGWRRGWGRAEELKSLPSGRCSCEFHLTSGWQMCPAN